MNWGVLTWDNVAVVVRGVEGKQVCFDPGEQTLFEAYAAALASVDIEGFEWLIQFDDDVWLCPDFAELALDALSQPDAANASLVNFLGGKKACGNPEGVELRAGRRGGLFGPGVAFRTRDLPDLLEWLPVNAGRFTWTETDKATAEWAAETDRRWFFTAPSLVQHVGRESLLGRKFSPDQVCPSYTDRWGKDRL